MQRELRASEKEKGSVFSEGGHIAVKTCFRGYEDWEITSYPGIGPGVTLLQLRCGMVGQGSHLLLVDTPGCICGWRRVVAVRAGPRVAGADITRWRGRGREGGWNGR